MIRLALSVLAAFLALGCSCGAIRLEPMTSSADALWGGVDGFCARDDRGLTCWRSPDGVPRRVEGLEGDVERVAFTINQACALDGAGVACWPSLEPVALRMRALGDVRELVSLSGWRGRFCALRADGSVVCWRRPDETPEAIATEAVHLHVTTGGDMICVESAEGRLRCHEFHDALAPVRTLETRIAPPLRRVVASTIAGELWVLDAEGLKHGRGQSSVVGGNPFAGDVLDGTLREIPFQRVAVTRVAEARDVDELLGGSIWIYVDDAAGVRMVEDHLGRFEVRHTYDFGAPPDALLATDRGLVFARAGGRLEVRGVADGDQVRAHAEVRDPAQVVIALDRFCVRHAEGVSCGAVPE